MLFNRSARSARVLSQAVCQALEARRLLTIDGDLLESCGDGGIVIDSLGVNSSRGAGIGVQSTGKVVVLASTTVNNITTGRVIRYNTDGSRDSTFGTQGHILIPAPPQALAIDSQDRILVTDGNNLYRYTSAGAVDNAFSGDGQVPASVGRDIEVQSDDKVVVVNSAGITRYTAAGALDNPLGTNGIVALESPSPIQNLTVFDSAIASDGSIFVSGTDDTDQIEDQIVFKISSTGVIDNNFTFVGKYSDDCSATGVAVQSDGKVLLLIDDGGEGAFLSRLNTDGTNDNTFGQSLGGVDDPTAFQLQANRGASQVLVDATDRIYVASRAFSVSDGTAAVERRNADGTIDATFSYGGVATVGSTIEFEETPRFGQVALSATGVIYGATGAIDSDNSSQTDLLVAAFQTEGDGVPFAQMSSTGTLLVNGTRRADAISIEAGANPSAFIVRRGLDAINFEPSSFRRIYVDAGAGNDSITNGLNRPATLIGNLGNDFIGGSVGNALEVLEGSAGDDTLRGGDGAELLLGGAGNDSLDGARGGDTHAGGAGNDTLDIGEQIDGDGDDFYFGNADFDTFTAQFAGAPVRITLDGVTNDGRRGDSDNVAADIEQILGGSGDDTITGAAGQQVILGNGGNDKLSGLGGDDQLSGGSGRDTLDGGDGNDQLQARDGLIDTLAGGLGTDIFDGDSSDIVIEDL